MTDAWGDAFIATAVIASLASILLSWYVWGRWQSSRTQMATLARITAEQAEKVERLGGTVAALRATVETKLQRMQISALERQVEVATAALKMQHEPIEVPRVHPTGVVAAPNGAPTTIAGPKGETAIRIGPFDRMLGWVEQRRHSGQNGAPRRPRRGTEG
ncbi:MAG TPA: hypothetical protein VGS23_02830 [Thermoplasmata archaeon]|nr:hypothetical protein [Thermoplasmata archaeon]